MYEVNHIIEKLKHNEQLTKQERFQILNSKQADAEIFDYLADKFQNLTINIVGRYKGDILNLMKRGLLEGWCWPTTETSIVFLNDQDYIERGYLTFDQYDSYYHSWIHFSFNNEEYVFDPCLDFLCKKSLYSKIFETDVKGTATAKEVRESLIDSILNPKPKKQDTSETARRIDQLMRELFGDELDKKKEEVLITGSDDVNSPMYRNNTGYKAEIENGKIKKLTAHYYETLL